MNEAIKECRARGDADWLLILGFSFESDIQSQSVTTSMGSFEVTKARSVADIAYWMVDDDYDGSNFIVRQVFFSGSEDKDEFAEWKAWHG